jgi:potassium-transporting ATPase KdpC subunit
MKSFRVSCIFLLWMILITGVIYPMGITILGKVFFPFQAEGSLISQNDQVIGSALIGQVVPSDQYFHSRPSATVNRPYNSSYSGGSNLAVTGKNWQEKALSEAAFLSKENGGSTKPIPVDLVTASSSGLDPHISVDSAYYQAERVAQARGIALEKVDQCIEDNTEYPTLGFLGEARVNVLLLNLALDELQ